MCEDNKYNINHLLEPYNYLVRNSGKQIRTKIIKAFNVWLQLENKDLLLVSEIIELLHNSAILIDDIEDSSELRGGEPSAHLVYGIATTINCGNYGYFLALEKVVQQMPQHLQQKACKIYANQMIELHQGQGLDIYWRDQFLCPTEDQYLDMIRKKTGGLFTMAVKFSQLLSNCHEIDFQPFIHILGDYFQIRDDYANLVSDQYNESKTFCEDLTEGKFSFPIIHAINSDLNDTTVIDILRMRTRDRVLKEKALKKMQSLGSLEYTLNRMKQLDAIARDEVKRLGDNPEMIMILDILNKI